MTDHRAEAEKHLATAARHLTEVPADMRIAEVAAWIGQGYATLALADATHADRDGIVRAEILDEEPSSPSIAQKTMALSATPEAWARLGQSLRESREAKGLSRRALSEKADVAEKSIQIAEEGRVPSRRWPQSIGRIAAVLGWEPGAAVRLVLTEYTPERAS